MLQKASHKTPNFELASRSVFMRDSVSSRPPRRETLLVSRPKTPRLAPASSHTIFHHLHHGEKIRIGRRPFAG